MAVQVVFTSKDENVNTTLEKLGATLVKLREENKKLAQESKQGHHDVTAAVRSHSLELIKVFGGITSVGAAVSATTGAYDTWRQHLRDLSAEHKKFVTDTLQGFAKIQALSDLPAFEKFEKAHPQSSREAVAAVWEGVRKQAPVGTITPEQVAALAEPVLPFEKVTDTEGLRTLGETQRQFQKLPGYEKLPPKQIFEKVVAARQAAAGHAEELSDAGMQRLIRVATDSKVAKDTDEAVAIAAEGAQHNMKLRSMLGAIETISEKQKVPALSMGKPSAERAAIIRLNKLEPDEKFQALVDANDPAHADVMGLLKGKGIEWQAITREGIGRARAGIAGSEGAPERELGAVQKSEMGVRAFRGKEQGIKHARTQELEELIEGGWSRAETELQDAFVKRGTFWLNRSLGEFTFGLSRRMPGATPGRSLRSGLRAAITEQGEIDQPDVEEFERKESAMRRELEKLKAEESPAKPAPPNQGASVDRRSHKLMERQIALLERIHSRQNTTGYDINRHVEV